MQSRFPFRRLRRGAPRGDRMPGRIFRETNGLTAGRNRSYNKNEQNTVANPPKGGDAKLKGLYG